MEDPWDARTLEWMTTSPPPVYNFDEIPTVHALDEFWHRKYVEDERTGRLVPVQAGAAGSHDDAGTRRPRLDPSAEPVVLAAGRRASGCPSSATASLYSWWLVALGSVVALVGFYGWAFEPSVAEE